MHKRIWPLHMNKGKSSIGSIHLSIGSIHILHVVFCHWYYSLETAVDQNIMMFQIVHEQFNFCTKKFPDSKQQQQPENEVYGIQKIKCTTKKRSGTRNGEKDMARISISINLFSHFSQLLKDLTMSFDLHIMLLLCLRFVHISGT